VATLYSISLSHPGHAARLMLERKGIEHRVVDLVPGMHPALLRLRGFRGSTVPALRIDGQSLQGSLVISQALEQIRPQPALFPSDPERRRAVEEAERWGERELQPLPRRLFRWGVATQSWMRRLLTEEVGMPAPGVMAVLNIPVARVFARRSGATDERIRADIASLPSLLDRVDQLIGDGTIGAAEPNAADFQIGTSLRALMVFDDLRPALEGRPAADLALRVLPKLGRPVPALAPPQWLEPLQSSR
jgi:glutathione S-transferase